jgi:1-phosphofructokinase family hexose kinase
MILCVTPNPAVDRAMIVPGYGAGGVFRPGEVVISAGGKGINVARAIRTLGGEAMNAGFVGGRNGAHIAELVEREGIPAYWTRVATGESRMCTILADPDRDQTSVMNELGPQVSEQDWVNLGGAVLRAAEPLEYVCICGSLPPGSSLKLYAGLLRQLHEAGERVWVDTSGEALTTVARLRGVCIKVNNDEIALLTGATVTTLPEMAEAAKQLSRQTEAPVVVTAGAQGAILADDSGCWLATPPAIKATSAVGSGDSFLAGLVLSLSRGESADVALRWAVGAGAANALSMGSGRLSRTDAENLFAQTEVQAV